MKIWIPTNPFWYIAIIILFGPFLLMKFISPEWLGRFSTIFIFETVIPIMMILDGLTGYKLKLKGESPLYWRFGKEKVQLALRVFLVILGILMVVILLPALIRDFVEVKAGRAPLTIVGFVADTDRLLPKNIILESRPSRFDNTFEAWFFSPRQIMKGNTYEFFYIPNTHYILEAHLIKEGRK